MDSTNILKPTLSLDFGLRQKILRFLAAGWLSTIFMGIVGNFLDRLNTKGILGMGEGFSTSHVFWGDGIGMNIARILFVATNAAAFGFIYAYLVRRISSSQSIIINTINSVLSVLGTSVLILLVIATMKQEQNFGENISLIIYAISSSYFYLTLFFIQLLVGFFAGVLGVALGCKIINNPYYTLDKERAGTFLGIKWYHYAWLWLPIGFYGQIILNLVYATIHTVITLILNIKWYEIFGVSKSGEEQSSLSVAWGHLIWIYIAGAITIYLTKYLREILAGERQMKWWLKLLIVLGISVGIPALVIIYLPIAF